MPSLRVLSVVILVGMGAAVAAASGVTESGEPGNEGLRGMITARSGATASGAASDIAGTLSADGSGVSATSGAAFDVSAENERTGTPGWRISRAQGARAGLAGYAGAVSVLPGQPVPLSVSADGPVRIRALRIGWYGGLGARQVWEGTLQAQPEAADPRAWPIRGRADTTGWPEGHYLLRLDRGDASRYLPLTVRSADNRGRVVVLTSPITWVSENITEIPPLGSEVAAPSTGPGTGTGTGTSRKTETSATAGLLAGPSAGMSAGSRTARSSGLTKVSFNRPYAAGYGAAGFLPNDAGLIRLAERTGQRIGFLTDYDVATHPDLLTGAAAVLIGGDSQYWPASLRTAIRAAGDAGTNLAFFGAGTGARKVRLLDGGRALQISRAKPSTSVRLTGLRPSCSVKVSGTQTGTTTAAAGTGRGSSTGESESAESGSAGSGSAGSGSAGSAADPRGDSGAGWVVSNAAWWGYRGTGVKTGDVLAGLVFDRVDRASTSSAGSPQPMQVLSFTRVPCASAAGSVAQSGIYFARTSGAAVFAAGTSRWACALTNTCSNRAGQTVRLDADARRVVARVTRNVINAFAEAKAGERYSARNSATQYAALR